MNGYYEVLVGIIRFLWHAAPQCAPQKICKPVNEALTHLVTIHLIILHSHKTCADLTQKLC